MNQLLDFTSFCDNVFALQNTGGKIMGKIKKAASLLLAVSMLFVGGSFSTNAATPITLVIDGKTVQSDVAPIIQNSRTLVPLRVIMENLGAQVKWEASTGAIAIDTAAYHISFTVNSQSYIVNGDKKTLDAAPVVISDRTMIPIRALAESIGAEVNFDSAKNIVSVNYFTKGISGSISMSGSSALYPLANTAVDQFKAINPKVSANVAAGGSGTGLNNVLAGAVDIGNSDVYASEKLQASDANKLIDHKVCLIGVSVIVNSDVGAAVKNLTKDQLKNIFNGTITNWKDVGGPNEAITIINRPSSSGTRALFVKWALDGQTDVEGDVSLQTDDSNALLTTVANTKGTIGYLALSYLVNSNANISKIQIDGVDATYTNIYNNKYQVWGYEHMYTNGTPTGAVAMFLDYMTSSIVAAEAENMGYGAIMKLNDTAAKSR